MTGRKLLIHLQTLDLSLPEFCLRLTRDRDKLLSSHLRHFEELELRLDTFDALLVTPAQAETDWQHGDCWHGLSSSDWRWEEERREAR